MQMIKHVALLSLSSVHAILLLLVNNCRFRLVSLAFVVMGILVTLDWMTCLSILTNAKATFTFNQSTTAFEDGLRTMQIISSGCNSYNSIRSCSTRNNNNNNCYRI